MAGGVVALILGLLLLISGIMSTSLGYVTCGFGVLLICAGIYGLVWSRASSRKSKERSLRMAQNIPAHYIAAGGPVEGLCGAFRPMLQAHATAHGARLEQGVTTSAQLRPIDFLLVHNNDHYCFVFLPEIPWQHMEALVDLLAGEHRRFVNARYTTPKALRLSAPAIVSVFVLPNMPPQLGETLARSIDTMIGGESCHIHFWDPRRNAWYHPPKRQTQVDMPIVDTVALEFKTIDPANRTFAYLRTLWPSFQAVIPR